METRAIEGANYVGIKKKSLPGRGNSKCKGPEPPEDYLFKVALAMTLRQTAGAEKTLSPSGRVEGLSISDQTIFCLLGQTVLPYRTGILVWIRD